MELKNTIPKNQEATVIKSKKLIYQYLNDIDKKALPHKLTKTQKQNLKDMKIFVCAALIGASELHAYNQINKKAYHAEVNQILDIYLFGLSMIKGIISKEEQPNYIR
ncbi:MAG: hypothetical protein QXL51_06945 [Candidatus Aenigmatarchaeota archaeon]